MGMFDYVKCDYPLPRAEDVGAEFQTKDFDNPFMEQYIITAEGRLTKPKVRYEDRSDPKAEGLMAFCGMMTPVPTGEIEDLNWHGYLHFGDYKAKFTDGKVVEIVIDENAW